MQGICSVKKSFTLFNIIFLFPFAGLLCQNNMIKGRVIDAETNAALPFVNIVYNHSGEGLVTGMNGNFQIGNDADPRFLEFSYVGYESHKIELSGMPAKDLLVALQPKAYSIDEIRVFPGINPAHRIIELVTQNKKNNNPENLESFSYMAYDKMTFTFNQDSSTEGDPVSDRKVPREKKDLSGNEKRKFLNRQHLFLMETVSSRKYKKPGLSKEEIIASRISGFKQPSFVLLATQFQSFSFYDDPIIIGNKKYLNPVSRGSTSKYSFILEDTLFTNRDDTVFIISYRPLRNRNFDGLKGILYINSYNYAIQNVLAQAATPEDDPFTIKIQQQYDLQLNKYWFPVQLNTTIIFHNLVEETESQKMRIMGTGKSFLFNININPDFSKSEFDNISVEIHPDAHEQTVETWDKYRIDSLTLKDLETYRIVDSIGESNNFDFLFKQIETIATGYLPVRFFNINLRGLIDFNSYEGLRMGFGGHTNKNLSAIVSVGGHAAYGFRDKEWKYGTNVALNISNKHETRLRFSYLDDLTESGGYSFYQKPSLLNTENYRKFMIENMDRITKKEIELESRIFGFMKFSLYLNQNILTATNDYTYRLYDNNPALNISRFYITEAGFKFRYAYRENLTRTPEDNIFSLGTRFPVLYGNIIKGMDFLNGNFDYLKLEARISKIISYKTAGETSLDLSGGIANGELPYPVLYNGYGSYRPFTVEAKNTFATMRMNEFLADRFVSLFIRHNFGNPFFRNRYFNPEFIIVNNTGFGDLKKRFVHNDIRFNIPDKGYYECGILVNNLLKQRFVGYGIGIYYRYGPYTFSQISDNFACRFTISYNL